MRGLRRPVVVAAVVALGAAAAAFAFDSRGRRTPQASLPRVRPPRALARAPRRARAPAAAGGVGAGRPPGEVRLHDLRGYVPGAINPGRDFLVSRLPAAGYRLGAGDAEATEAEAVFTGHGVRGKFKLRHDHRVPRRAHDPARSENRRRLSQRSVRLSSISVTASARARIGSSIAALDRPLANRQMRDDRLERPLVGRLLGPATPHRGGQRDEALGARGAS